MHFTLNLICMLPSIVSFSRFSAYHIIILGEQRVLYENQLVNFACFFFPCEDCWLCLVSRVDGGGSQCKAPSVRSSFSTFVVSVFSVLINCDLAHVRSTPLLKQGKEEFSTGPLSVLMMGVKNNTQVGTFLQLL